MFGGGSGGGSPDEGTFEFTYDRTARTVEIEFVEGDEFDAGDVEIRTSDGDSAVWSELGSTTVAADEPIPTGSVARVGNDVVNWPSAVDSGESVRVVYAPSEKSVTELDRFEAPTPTPSPTPTPTPTARPVATVTGFESGELGAWTVAEVGETGSGEWDVTGDNPFEGAAAAHYQGDRARVLASTTGLERYPSRGDVFTLHRAYTAPRTGGSFGFGVQSTTFDRGYRVHVRHAGWAEHANTAMLAVRTGNGERTLDRVPYDVAAFTDQYLRWEVRWGEPTVDVRAVDEAGTEVLRLSADDDTYDDGGVAIGGNSSEGTDLYYDALRVRPGDA